jgi:hypothetical protein
MSNCTQRICLIAALLPAILMTGRGAPAAEKNVPLCRCNELDARSPEWQLYLRAKDPATWRVIEGGSWALLTINRPAGKFALEAQGLSPHREYALVHVTQQDRAGEVLCRAKADAQGLLRCSGAGNAWSEKYWLVLSEDLRGNPADFPPGGSAALKNWRPASYLFESEQLLPRP